MLGLIKDKCIGCGICVQVCPFGCIEMKDGLPVINDFCTFCGLCADKCPKNALSRGDSSVPKTDISGFKDFWVVTQFDETGKIKKASLELLSKARELAGKKQAGVCALVLCNEVGKDAEKAISDTGCDKLLHLKNENLDDYDTELYTKLISKAILENKPEVVLFAATEIGRDLAPRIASRIKTGLTADCTGLDIDQKGNLLQIRPTYGGNIMATIVTPNHRPQMATVRPNVMRIVSTPNDTMKKERLDLGSLRKTDAAHLVNRIRNEMAYIDVSEASLVISGGYGLKNAENFQWIYKVASKLNAAVGATRKVVDEGWAPMEIQVGQTGKTVGPDLYIAFGISGALQHAIGMKNSKRIIAVNNDPAASIFNFADVAVLGDAVEILKAVCDGL
jgi:electron transfer flavoprotein alpha subunit